MAIALNSVPTTNAIDLRATFLYKGVPVKTLGPGEANTLTLVFDSIGVGTTQPLSVYNLQTQTDVSLNPGTIAFLDRSVDRRIALRFGAPGGTQQNVVFILE